jgi:formylglycine-generating enzyme required for sulfatase activity
VKCVWPLFSFSILVLLVIGCGQDSASLETEVVTDNGGEAPESEVAPPTLSPGDTQIRSADNMVMVQVPSSEFMMGSETEEVDRALEQCHAYGVNCSRRYFPIEQPAHLVALDNYWLDETEVTNGQYTQCVDAGRCQVSGCEEESRLEAHPVVCVTWEQANAYCDWVGGRLPTEAEWEYAARGIESSTYPWGNEFDSSKVNYCDGSCELEKRDENIDDGYAATAPVGSYPSGASWTGAQDMAGNVWEWTADYYGPYSADAQDNPIGPPSGGRLVVRGGSWHASPDHLRSAIRSYAGSSETFDHMGFRCAVSSPEH